MKKINFTELYTEVKQKATNNTLEEYIKNTARILPTERNHKEDIQYKIDILNEISDAVLIMQSAAMKNNRDKYLSLIKEEITRLQGLLNGV